MALPAVGFTDSTVVQPFALNTPVYATVPAAYPEQKSVRNIRAHREMFIHIERIVSFVLGRIVMHDSRSEISRFDRNMPA